MRLIPAAAAATLLLTSVAAGPALAVAPANDEYPGRVTLSGELPLDYAQDTTEATLGLEDAAFVAGCDGAPPTEASVWFQYTAEQSGGLALDMTASDYAAGAVIATGNPTDGWQVAACGPGVAGWIADAGVTYTMLVFDDFDTPGSGGNLAMTLDVIPPPPTLDVTVNKTASFNSKTGEATVSGMATCTPAPGQEEMSFAFLDIQLTQRVGRILIRGWGGTDVTCDGAPRPWSAIILGDNGLFKGGKAANVTTTFACGAFDCALDFIETTVQLKGAKAGKG
jgi:hypothetical protein